MPDLELHDLVDQVATELGGEWTKEPPSDDHVGAYLVGPDNARLFVRRAERDRTRVAVLGRYPQTDFRAPSIGIKVARDRGPTVIAAEIRRRLLPDYLVNLARVVERNRERDQAAASRTHNAGELAKTLPGATVQDDGHHGTTRVHWYKPYKTQGDPPSEVTVEMAFDGQRAYRLDLHNVDIGLAEQILRLIQQRV